MPSKPIFTEIDGRRLKLTNLDKILYPSVGVLKAEVINFYLENAALFLPYLKDRPLTVIRWPDGIEGKKFYSKNKPKWTPKWIPSVQIPGEDNNYLLANERAILGWLGNLAALELHPMGSTSQQIDHPDHLIFDLDPLTSNEFPVIKELAFLLKEYLEKLGYVPFLKTSGSKGLHIYIPIEPKWTFKEAIESLKKLCQNFIQSKAPHCTLAVHKGKRKDKILLDIYRNYRGNTCVAPYSLRGKAGAPISTPIFWDQLAEVNSSGQFTLRNIKVQLAKGDPWENFKNSARPIHDYADRSKIVSTSASLEKLDQYNAKRDFTKTKEPTAEIPNEAQQRFVIQLHDASNLHYDLRLESEGTLLSWAIPKALPTKKDKARLAIRTEDHPVKYLDFEGIIPKEEYGGGEMWIIERGRYEWIEKKEGKLKFKLNGDKFECSYNLFKTKNNQWLCKVLSAPVLSVYANLPQPMLANARKTIPKATHYHHEIKWDGIRVFIIIEEEDLKIISRSGRDITKHFPKLRAAREEFEIEEGVFDGEIVVLDESGKPLFSEVISRMHTTGENTIARASISKRATCYIFDCLVVDGHQMMYRPQERRYGILRAVIPKMKYFRVSEVFEDGEALFKGIQEAGMEGIMSKDKKAPYFPGKRSDGWLKIKVRSEIVATVIGYTKGQGARSGMIGALHLAQIKEEKIVYLGKVGTGFDHSTLQAIMEKLKSIAVISKPIKEDIEEASRTVWLDSKFKCNIEYASLASTGTLREPVWKGWAD